MRLALPPLLLSRSLLSTTCVLTYTYPHTYARTAIYPHLHMHVCMWTHIYTGTGRQAKARWTQASRSSTGPGPCPAPCAPRAAVGFPTNSAPHDLRGSAVGFPTSTAARGSEPSLPGASPWQTHYWQCSTNKRLSNKRCPAFRIMSVVCVNTQSSQKYSELLFLHTCNTARACSHGALRQLTCHHITLAGCCPHTGELPVWVSSRCGLVQKFCLVQNFIPDKTLYQTKLGLLSTLWKKQRKRVAFGTRIRAAWQRPCH